MTRPLRITASGIGRGHVMIDEAHRFLRKRLARARRFGGTIVPAKAPRDDTLDRLRRELRREPPHVVDEASDLFKIITGTRR
jgi:hypothetical protein